MAEIPRADDMQRLIPSGEVPVVRVDPGNVGGTIAESSSIIQRQLDNYQERRARFEASRVESEFLTRKVEQDYAYDQDEDYQTYTERYTENLSQTADELAQQIPDQQLRNQFMDQARLQIARGKVRMAAKAMDKEKDVKRGQLTTQLQNLRDAVVRGQGIEAMQSATQLIENAKALDYMSDEEAAEVLHEWKASASRGWIESLPPEQAVEQLESELAQNLPEDVRIKLLRSKRTELIADRAQASVDTYETQGLTRTQMYQQAAQIDDADERAETERRIDVTLRRRNDAELEEQSAIMEKYYAPVRQGDMSVDQIPEEEFDKLSPANQSSLFNAESQSVYPAVSDPTVLDELYGYYQAGRFDVLRTVFLMKGNKLSASHFDLFSKISNKGVVEEPEKYDPLFTETATLKAMAEAAGVPDKHIATMQDKLIRWALKEQQVTGKNVTSAQYQQRIDQLMMEEPTESWYENSVFTMFMNSPEQLYELSDEELRVQIKDLQAQYPAAYNDATARLANMRNVPVENLDPVDVIEAVSIRVRNAAK